MAERNISVSSATPRPTLSPSVSSETPTPASSLQKSDMDFLFPGENWFFYWRTSASLWETKLNQCSAGTRLCVPINWAFHSETGDTFDFADTRPETDLKRLLEIARKGDRELLFLVPLGPCPFLPNGGLPVFLARILAMDEDAHPQIFVDGEGNLNRFYSFFDQRVFKAFSKFVRQLGRYFSQSGINCDVLGFYPGYLEGEEFRPYLLDSSRAFKSALAQYVQIQSSEQNVEPTPEHGQKWESDFAATIGNLYYQEAQTALKSNWEGTIHVNFLGGGIRSLFDRAFENDSALSYFLPLFEMVTHGQWPSSVLLPERLKKGALKSLLQDITDHSPLAELKGGECLSDEEDRSFQWPFLFEVYGDWGENGLLNYLRKTHPGHFRHHLRTWKNIDRGERCLYFFQGCDVDESLFRYMLKIFTGGGKVILNSSGIKCQYLGRFEAFCLENDLLVERVNYHVEVQNATMREGRFLILDAGGLAGKNSDQSLAFWRKILKTFSVRYLPIPEVEGVFHTWKWRATLHHELKYEEIRRLSLYNPTSYKKKVRIPIPKDFRLLKIEETVNAKFKGQSDIWEIELWPEGSMVMDFGVIS